MLNKMLIRMERNQGPKVEADFSHTQPLSCGRRVSKVKQISRGETHGPYVGAQLAMQTSKIEVVKLLIGLEIDRTTCR